MGTWLDSTNWGMVRPNKMGHGYTQNRINPTRSNYRATWSIWVVLKRVSFNKANFVKWEEIPETSLPQVVVAKNKRKHDSGHLMAQLWGSRDWQQNQEYIVSEWGIAAPLCSLSCLACTRAPRVSSTLHLVAQPPFRSSHLPLCSLMYIWAVYFMVKVVVNASFNITLSLWSNKLVLYGPCHNNQHTAGILNNNVLARLSSEVELLPPNSP